MTRTETLGNRIAQARLNLGAKQGRFISQAQLAEMIGLTGASVGNYEAGRTEPSYEIVARLARVLGVTAGFLAFGENSLSIPLEDPEVVEKPIVRPSQRKKKRA